VAAHGPAFGRQTPYIFAFVSRGAAYQPPPTVSYSHTINPTKRIIIQRFDGTLSLTSVYEGTEKLWADPNYDRAFDGITDLSHSVVSGSVDDVRALSRFVAGRENASTGRWAVVTNDPKITAFVLVFSRLMTRPSLSVFSTWAAASAYMHVETQPPA
jgi:hypothetical protein